VHSTSGNLNNSGLQACLSREELASIGVSLASLTNVPEGNDCIDISAHFPGGATEFNFQNMRLDISVPQAALQKVPRGWIPLSNGMRGQCRTVELAVQW
jgi:outer membrane usher protein